MDDNNLLFGNHYGFRKHHSTELPAIELIDGIYETMDQGDISISIFLDLSEAFDMLYQPVLSNQLKYYGVNDNDFHWLSRYLTGRYQYVDMEGVHTAYDDGWFAKYNIDVLLYFSKNVSGTKSWLLDRVIKIEPNFWSRTFQNFLNVLYLNNFVSIWMTITFGNQCGFRKYLSLELPAIELIDGIYENMDQGDISISTFLDLFKSFDMLYQIILLNKLKYYSVSLCVSLAQPLSHR